MTHLTVAPVCRLLKSTIGVLFPGTSEKQYPMTRVRVSEQMEVPDSMRGNLPGHDSFFHLVHHKEQGQQDVTVVLGLDNHISLKLVGVQFIENDQEDMCLIDVVLTKEALAGRRQCLMRCWLDGTSKQLKATIHNQELAEQDKLLCEKVGYALKAYAYVLDNKHPTRNFLHVAKQLTVFLAER